MTCSCKKNQTAMWKVQMPGGATKTFFTEGAARKKAGATPGAVLIPPGELS
jgi:hypothetical protein